MKSWSDVDTVPRRTPPKKIIVAATLFVAVVGLPALLINSGYLFPIDVSKWTPGDESGRDIVGNREFQWDEVC